MCQFVGCARSIKARGLCGGHYQQQHLGKPLVPLRIWPDKAEFCGFPECDRTDIKPKWGLCNAHSQQKRKGMDLFPLRNIHKDKTCKAPECDRPAEVKDLCRSHYNNMWQGRPVRAFNFEGICEGCGEWGRLNRDHNHSCCPLEKFPRCGNCDRGDLCRGCNQTLGNVKENLKTLTNLMEYLLKYNKENENEKV